MVTLTINISQMLAYIPYMDPMGNGMWAANQHAGFHGDFGFCLAL